MAVYGVSIYGRSKYGPDPRTSQPGEPGTLSGSFVDYSVSPFTAEAADYESILLSWNSPVGEWSEFRVVKNWHGFPTTENDGAILFNTAGAASGHVDRDVAPGRWHYYGLWVKSTGGAWQESGTACTLMLTNFGYDDLLFESLPEYHRFLQGLADDLPVIENDDLRRFLRVLAHGLNYVKSFYETSLYLNDPTRNRFSQLLRLAEQMGIEYSPVAPTEQFRKRVLNAGTLARQKGTMEEIRSVVSLMTGWDVDLSLGPNMMLTEDQASFVHPEYPQWDALINYPAGERVSYNGRLYAAKTGGAYGAGQAPSGTAAANTWWDPVSNLVDTSLTTAGTFAGWSPVSFTAGVQPPTNQVAVGVGVQSATDPTVSFANSLVIQNTGAQTADLGARAAGGDLSDPTLAVTRGIPIPRGENWDAGTDYRIGDVVLYGGSTYVAVSESRGVTPGTSTSDWVSTSWGDGRKAIIVSLHAKGDNAAAQGRLVYPVLDVFDEHGKLLGTLDAKMDSGSKRYDAFRGPDGTTLSGAPLTTGGGTWTVSSGTVYKSTSVGAYTAGAAFATTAGTADGKVAVTFGTQASGLSQALVLRSSDASNYLKATRTGLYSVSAGTPTLIANYSSAFADGDRITAVLSGTSITILKNDVSVLSTTSSVNTTATNHGILVS